MKQFPFLNELESNKYPGRGIIIGASPDKSKVFQIYWIMGRSASSRNRQFVLDGENVKTDLIQPTPGQDTSLIVYYPVKSIENRHIISNGDQTDTIYNGLKDGKTFDAALQSRIYEHDAPHYTSRISGLITCGPKADYALSIIKNTGEEIPGHYFFHYSGWQAGVGHCLTTYASDGEILPSFQGEPKELPVMKDAEENLDYYWNRLDKDNRISILVKEIDPATGYSNLVIRNKY